MVGRGEGGEGQTSQTFSLGWIFSFGRCERVWQCGVSLSWQCHMHKHQWFICMYMFVRLQWKWKCVCRSAAWIFTLTPFTVSSSSSLLLTPFQNGLMTSFSAEGFVTEKDQCRNKDTEKHCMADNILLNISDCVHMGSGKPLASEFGVSFWFLNSLACASL